MLLLLGIWRRLFFPVGTSVLKRAEHHSAENDNVEAVSRKLEQRDRRRTWRPVDLFFVTNVGPLFILVEAMKEEEAATAVVLLVDKNWNERRDLGNIASLFFFRCSVPNPFIAPFLQEK